MPVPFAMAALGGSAALKALLDAALVVGSALGVSVAVTEAQRRKKEVEAAKEAERAARQKAADDFARVGPFVEALKKAIEMAQEEDCSKRKECPALAGATGPVNHYMNPPAIAYQARITGFPPGVEWIFDSTDFDGFFPLLCQLVEAKANYDQFFINDSYTFKFFAFQGVKDALDQADRQYEVITKYPPTTLVWYFQTPLFHARMTEEFERAGYLIPTILKP